METLFRRHDQYMANTPMAIVRESMQEIGWDGRLIAVVGARGVGKSTLMKQYVRLNYEVYDRSVLYCSLDSVYFSTHTLLDLAERFVISGGTRLMLDEVHKYGGWSKEVKEIYELYPQLKIVISGSSLLQILNADADLSRRCVRYFLGGLSFREFLRFYKNLQNGEFQDVTNSPSLIESVAPIFDNYGWEKTGTIQDVFKAWGCEEGVTITLDFDQDGRPDLLQLGASGQRGLKQANCLRNVSDENGFRFEEFATEISPMATAASARFLWADFNGDDYPDYMMTGWTSKQKPDGSGEYGWSRVVDLSQGSTSYVNYFFEDGANEMFGAWMAKSDPGVNAFGDLDNDGLLDLFTSDYTNYDGRNDQQIINWNTSAGVEVTQPDAVDEVTATAEKGRVLVNWEASEMNNGNYAMFNVYIKNNETGEMHMVVPANIETGKQLAYAMFGCYVNVGNGDGMASYLFDKLPTGDYTVGVQAVNYAYQASEWTTTEVSVTESDYDGVASQTVGKGMSVSVNGNTIMVQGAEAAQVTVYSLQGAEVGTGVTGKPITVNGHGVFLVKAAGQVKKIVK